MTLMLSPAQSVRATLTVRSQPLFPPCGGCTIDDVPALSAQDVLRAYLRELVGNADSQNELARVIGIPPGDVSELLSRKRNFTMRHVDKIVTGLDMAFSDFLNALQRTAVRMEAGAPASVPGPNLAAPALRHEVRRVVSGGSAAGAAAASPPGARRG